MILYSDKLKENSRALRQANNMPEVLLWKKLQKRQLLDLLFSRQKPVGYYIADFYCHEKKVVIEIDGSSHIEQKAYDKERDLYMQSHGLKVIRVSAKDVLNNIDGVMVFLEREIKTPASP